MHKLSDVVHMDLNVLGSMFMNWVIEYLNGALIITVYRSHILQVSPATTNIELLHLQLLYILLL